MADTKKYAFFDDAFHQGLAWGKPVLIHGFGKERALTLNQTMKEKYLELKPGLPEMKTKTVQQLLIFAIRSSLSAPGLPGHRLSPKMPVFVIFATSHNSRSDSYSGCIISA